MCDVMTEVFRIMTNTFKRYYFFKAEADKFCRSYQIFMKHHIVVFSTPACGSPRLESHSNAENLG
jgi:hypothetical protein